MTCVLPARSDATMLSKFASTASRYIRIDRDSHASARLITSTPARLNPRPICCIHGCITLVSMGRACAGRGCWYSRVLPHACRHHSRHRPRHYKGSPRHRAYRRAWSTRRSRHRPRPRTLVRGDLSDGADDGTTQTTARRRRRSDADGRAMRTAERRGRRHDVGGGQTMRAPKWLTSCGMGGKVF